MPVGAGSTWPIAAAAATASSIDRRDGMARDVDTALQRGFFSLHFPPALEQRFEQDSAPERLRSFVLSSAIIGLIFPFSLIADWMMIPDQFRLALLLRAGIFVPICLSGILALPRIAYPYLREILVVLMGIGAAAIQMVVETASHSPLAPYYAVGLAVVLTYCNVMQRIRFRLALMLNVAVLVGHVIELCVLPPLPLVITGPVMLLLLSTMVFTLYSNYLLEHEERQNYLLRLREEQMLSNLAATNASLMQLSRCDPLTGVANRRCLDESLAQLWERARHDGSELSVLMFDVDFFKPYNDRYGHPAGDECLRRVAAAIRQALRESKDFVARFGGEEFLAVLPAMTEDAAIQAGERVRQAVADLGLLHEAAGGAGIVTISVGAAGTRPSESHASAAQLLAAADRAMYRAKKAGRNCVWPAAA